MARRPGGVSRITRMIGPKLVPETAPPLRMLRSGAIVPNRPRVLALVDRQLKLIAKPKSKPKGKGS